MKHLATLSLAVCGLAAAHANERGNNVLAGCGNQQAASAASAQAQRAARSMPQATNGPVIHSGGQVIHNTGQVVHRGGNVIHNTGLVAHNTPLLNRRAPNYSIADAPPLCATSD